MRGNKYAVLICGDVATHWGFDEFWNDVVLMREVLLRNGFSPENMFVLYGDGVDFSHPSRTNPRYIPGYSITNFAATIPNVELVFQGLANGDAVHNIPKMGEEDFLFVWTFDHGTSMGGHAYLCLRDGNMVDSDFALLVDQIDYSYRVFAMQQCFSGGFVNDLSNDQTVILTAAAPDELAWRADDNPTTENEIHAGVTYHHGEFNFHLFSALSWEKIDYTNVGVDTSLDRFASLSETFDYIQTNDTQTETTQYNDGALSIGTWMTLERDILVFMRDNTTDQGQTPSASPWWDSPDLWVRHNDDGGTSHQNPVSGTTNYVHARIKNRGVVHSGPVSVKFFCAGFSGTEFVYPDDYSDLVTWASCDGVPAGGEMIVKGPWLATEISSAPSHPCLLAEVYEHSGIPDSGTHVWESNHLTQKNLTISTIMAGRKLKFPIVVGARAIREMLPSVEVRLVEGTSDLRVWLEIRDTAWLDLIRRPAEVHRAASLAVEGKARLRVGLPAMAEEGNPQSMLLDLTEGSEILLCNAEDRPFVPGPSSLELAETWKGGKVEINLESPRELRLPPIIHTRKTLYLNVAAPRDARPSSSWTLDVVRKDHESKAVGGVRFKLDLKR